MSHTHSEMAATPLTGGCLCGGVRFEVDAPLVVASYCHCTRCQRRTGTASSAQARIAPGSLRITQGEALVRAYRPPRDSPRSTAKRAGRRFGASSQDDPDVISVRLGAFDADPGIRPSWRQFVAYAAPWEPIPDDGLPRYDERPPG